MNYEVFKLTAAFIALIFVYRHSVLPSDADYKAFERKRHGRVPDSNASKIELNGTKSVSVSFLK